MHLEISRIDRMAMEDFEGVSTIGVYVLLVLDPD